MTLVDEQLKQKLLTLFKPNCDFDKTLVYEGFGMNGRFHFYFPDKTSFSYSKNEVIFSLVKQIEKQKKAN